MNIAFIGLGIMGSRMAANLLKNGVSLTVFNRSPGPLEKLAAQGATAGESYQQAVEDCDIVFSMLASPQVIEEVGLAEAGFVGAMKPGAIWVDCSTVNPSFTRKAQEHAAACGLGFVDAPVAGTKPHAEEATLSFLVGGEEQTVEKITPLLSHMGQKILHIGPAGSGSSFKMLVNTMLAQAMAAFAETLTLGESLGLDRDYLLDTLPKLPVAAPFLQGKAELIRANDYEAQFPLELMYKDLHLVSQTGYEQKLPMPLAALTRELYGSANLNGLGREDFAAIFKR